MRRSIIDLIIAGLRNPSRIPRFLKRNSMKAYISASNITTPHQDHMINTLLGRDEFVLVILDACRFDTFQRLYTEYFEGNLQKIYNTNTYTMEYLANTWNEEYDLTYISGGPVISDRRFEIAEWDYRPSEHFNKIVDVWNMQYEKELGVTPPEPVTNVALDFDKPKMIVHYFQPHAPYIGEERIRNGEYDYRGDSCKERNAELAAESMKQIYDKIEKDEISDEVLKRAYKSNLERVMSSVKELVSSVDKKVVITSDHGEMLGEGDRYMHGGSPSTSLCSLPWLEVDNIKGEVQEHSGGDYIKPDTQDASDEEVQQQLKNLGYL
jgi:predicted AlkP superfamily pyrophosphatase or phosphodiesterase